MSNHERDGNGNPPSVPNPSGISVTVIVVAVVVVALFSISAVTYLVAAGRDIDAVVALLTALAAPTIASLIGLVRTEVVKKQTNGALTRMDNRMSTLETKVPAAVNDPAAEMRDNG